MMGMIKAKQWTNFRPGSGEIWLDDLGCTGNESNLFDCTHSPFGKHYCSHSEDVWVVCDGKYIPTIYLESYSNMFSSLFEQV